jgi:hypothetical protein
MGRHDLSYRQLFAHPGMVASLLRLLRMLAYVALLAQDLAASRTLTPDGRIPEVIPLVVYTGDRRWGAPAEAGECFAGTGPHRPQMSFRLVDQRKVPAGRLLRTPGPVGALFLLERHRTPAELEQGIRLLVRRLAAPEDAPLRRAFLVWLQAVLMPGRNIPEQEIPALLDLQELRSMLETRVREWNRQLRNEGRGYGEAAVLLRLLETRFGPLDEAVRARVRRATSDQRLAWATRVLTAGSLAEVFRR